MSPSSREWFDQFFRCQSLEWNLPDVLRNSLSWNLIYYPFKVLILYLMHFSISFIKSIQTYTHTHTRTHTHTHTHTHIYIYIYMRIYVCLFVCVCVCVVTVTLKKKAVSIYNKRVTPQLKYILESELHVWQMHELSFPFPLLPFIVIRFQRPFACPHTKLQKSYEFPVGCCCKTFFKKRVFKCLPSWDLLWLDSLTLEMQTLQYKCLRYLLAFIFHFSSCWSRYRHLLSETQPLYHVKVLHH